MSAGGVGGEYDLRPLDGRDGAAMLGVNRACHIAAGIALRFDREPDVFGWPARVFDAFHYEGAFASGRLVGYGMVGYRRGWLGDRHGPWGYVGDFRVLPAHRGRGLAARMADALAGRVPAEVGLWAVLVPRGNRAAERAREAQLLPPWMVGVGATDMEVVSLPTWIRRRGDGGCTVERLVDGACEPLAAFLSEAVTGRLLAPEIVPEMLRRYAVSALASEARWGWIARRGERIVGALLATDQSACRQVTILRYGTAAWPVRAAWRLVGLVRRGVVPLPPAGLPLRGLTVTLLAAEGGDVAVARELLAGAAAWALEMRVPVVHVGFAAADPLCGAVRGWPRSVFRSRLHAVARREALGPALAALVRPPLLDLELA